MSFVFGLLSGLIGALAGWFGLAFLVMVLSGPDRDGGIAMGAFFNIGPIGGLIGFVAGATWSNDPAADAHFASLCCLARDYRWRNRLVDLVRTDPFALPHARFHDPRPAVPTATRNDLAAEQRGRAYRRERRTVSSGSLAQRKLAGP